VLVVMLLLLLLLLVVLVVLVLPLSIATLSATVSDLHLITPFTTTQTRTPSPAPSRIPYPLSSIPYRTNNQACRWPIEPSWPTPEGAVDTTWYGWCSKDAPMDFEKVLEVRVLIRSEQSDPSL
jgi:hypothetical protein